MTRRLFVVLTAAVAALLCFTGPVASAAAAPNSPWSQGDSDAAHSRSNRTETTLNHSSIDRISFLRSITAQNVRSGPICPKFGAAHVVLSGNVVYGVFAGRVSAYNARTRALIWRTNYNVLTNWTSVSAVDGLVVAGNESCDSASDPNGSVAVFRAGDGTRVRTLKPSDGGIFGTVVSDGVVLSHAYGDDTTLTDAWSLSTGKRLWSRDTRCNNGNATVVRGLSVTEQCGSRSGALVASALRTGKPVWRKTGKFKVLAGDSDTASAQHLYVRQGKQVLDLDPATGATRRTLSGATGVLAVAGSRVFTTCGSGTVCAYRIDTGAKDWSVASNATLGAAAAGVLYLSDGTIRNAYNGSKLHQLGYRTATQLVVGDGRVGAVQSPRILDLFGLSGS